MAGLGVMPGCRDALGGPAEGLVVPEMLRSGPWLMLELMLDLLARMLF